MIIGGKVFDLKNNVYVMGILNVTPDSFSDGGYFSHLDDAVDHALSMERDGAAIIDVGGESTRPGHAEVSSEEEIKRVVPVIQALKKSISLPISIDTSKAEVAEAALNAGADLLNDVWGFKRDPLMAQTVVKWDVPCCLMHNRDNTLYDNLIDDIKSEISECVNIARAAGVRNDQIIIDPGIGFGKTVEQNLAVMNHLEKFTTLGYPLLLGASRKSMIGAVLDLPVNDRLEGTLATTALASFKGAAFVRVHDVKTNIRVIRMLQAIREAGNK